MLLGGGGGGGGGGGCLDRATVVVTELLQPCMVLSVSGIVASDEPLTPLPCT